MKQLKAIKLVAATGLVLGSLNAAASGFGGGWVQDKNTGTIYNSLATTPERHHASHDKMHGGGHMNSFGGGWVQDKNTGTIYYSHADKVKQGAGFSPS